MNLEGRRIRERARHYGPAMTRFLRDLIALPSESCGEEAAIRRIGQEMESVGFDEVRIDPMGNILGAVGTGDRIVAFDAHVDTVGIGNRENWTFDPYGGFEDGERIGGRGASDQEGGMASMVYAGRIIRDLGLEGDYTLVGVPSAPTGLVDSVKIVNGIIEMTIRDAYRSLNEDDAHVGLRVRDSKGTEVYTEYTLRIRTEIPVARWIPASMNTRVTPTSAAQVLSLQGAGTGVTYNSLEVLPALANASASVDVATGQVRISPPVVSGRNQEISLRATLAEGAITLGKISREYHVPTTLGTGVTSWIAAALPLQQGSLFAFDLQLYQLDHH